MSQGHRLFTCSRGRIVNLLVAATAFALTEIGRYVYRPYVYDHDINDLGIADTMGNHLGTVALVYATLTISHANRRDGLVMMAVIVPGLILYEFAQELLAGSTFDPRDVVATLVGGALSAAIYRLAHPAPREDVDNGRPSSL